MSKNDAGGECRLRLRGGDQAHEPKIYEYRHLAPSHIAAPVLIGFQPRRSDAPAAIISRPRRFVQATFPSPARGEREIPSSALSDRPIVFRGRLTSAGGCSTVSPTSLFWWSPMSFTPTFVEKRRAASVFGRSSARCPFRSWARRCAALRHELTSPDLSFLMEGAHNGLSAKLVEEAGFPAIWASGLAISAALGVRDNNEASWTQGARHPRIHGRTRRRCRSSSTAIPAMAISNNVRRLVRKLCQRGIAGVCIEDKLFPKTNSFLGEAPAACRGRRVSAAASRPARTARPRRKFSLVARIEALISGHGLDEALRRAEAYHAAGADAGADPFEALDRRRDPRLRRALGKSLPGG